jgi:mono/diheme cytochrome c family protein
MQRDVFKPRKRENTKAFIALVIMLVADQYGSSGQQAKVGDAGNGKRVFTSYYCYACHGTEGQGGVGPRLIARATADPLIRYVRKPSGVMPAYTSKVISEQDLIDIHAYLKSIPPSPPAKSIPLLNQ